MNSTTSSIPSASQSQQPGPSDNNVTSDKSSLVELRNGKIVFKQKSLSLERQSETMQETVAFRDMLAERIEKGLPAMTFIPADHLAVIPKLAFESDKTSSALAKYIRQELLPIQDADDDDDASASAVSIDPLPVQIVEAAIKSVMTRNNYGLNPPAGCKSSASNSIWRWEVKDEHQDMLPKNSREKAENRLAIRIQAKKELADLFDLLPDDAKDAIFPGYSATTVKPVASQTVPASAEASGSKAKRNSIGADDNNSAEGSKKIKSKKTTDPEKAAKEKEKAEKKATKAEKEKKEKDAQNKSRSLMANFFAKAKPPSSAPTVSEKRTEASPTIEGPSQSQFDKTFKPFVLKKDTVLAPVNWFLQRPEIIILDDDIASKEPIYRNGSQTRVDIDFSQMNAQERLQSVIASMSGVKRPASGARPLHLRRNGINVRDILGQLSEAEVTGDTAMVRSLLSKLSNRSLVPAKVLIFHEDARPGYFGTWTKDSKHIRPRKPFGKDVVLFDYGYDSEEDWEEEPVGDADDVAEDVEEEVESEAHDSDEDDWLVEDDDEEPGTPIEARDQTSILGGPLPAPILKRKADTADKNLAKKRKVVVPLVAYAKGPCLESTVGQCTYEPFESYQLRLLNDSPFPLNPFIFVSQPPSKLASTVPAFILPPARDTDVPMLPPPIPALSTDTVTTTPAAKKAPVRKSVFPDVHAVLLRSKITELKAASLTWLVESLYQELREHKVKKTAIEAKVREVAEKCKDKKVWVLKTDLQTIAT